MERVFLNTEGKWYKAEEPKSANDIEKPCISVEGLAVLTEEPITQLEWDELVRKHKDGAK